MTRPTTESSPSADNRVTRYPLHITLAAVFVTALVVFGVAVIAYSYIQGRRVELLGAEDLMERIGRQLSADIAGLYQPAQGLVDITSRSAIWAGDTLEERLLALPPVAEALQLNSSISAFYIGYESGDFFLIRTLDQNQVAGETLEAPEGSSYAIQSIEVGEVQRESITSAVNLLILFLLLMALLTAFVGSIGLMGTMSINVLERTREIGVMRTIGAMDAVIMQSVIIEGLVIGLITWIVGIGLSYPISSVLLDIVARAISDSDFTLVFTSLGVFVWLGVVVVLSIVASVMPARNAARLTINEVLAYE